MQHEHAASGLTELADLGLLHIEHQNPLRGEQINLLNEQLALIEQAGLILSALEVKAVASLAPHQDLISLSHRILDLQKRITQLKEYAVTLNAWIDQWSPWGDFDPLEIKKLAQNNIYAKLYQMPRQQKPGLAADLILRKISSVGAINNCIVLGKHNFQLAFKEIEPPKMSLSQMRERLTADAAMISDLSRQLKECAGYYDQLSTAHAELAYQKTFYEALAGMAKEHELIYLKGYLPADAEDKLVKESKARGWGVMTLEPQSQDTVPTLLRNPAWISLLKPLLKLLELVPGYHEIDISPLFIIFFSLFFGMLIGDAGYGLVYLLLNFWLQRKLGPKIKDHSAFFLFYILSFCAIIWGILTGVFFGQEWLLNLGFKPLVPALGNAAFVQAFCFFIGALHLSLAHGWRAILKAPSRKALADIGWVCIIWAVFFLAKNLILGDLLPGFIRWLIFAGLALILFFNSPQKNILKTIAEGLGTIALNLVNNFTDVVSYIRLFAVGLATVAIADAFNSMAAGVFKKGEWLTFIAAALIVILGHALNIILGPMSVLVHGVRLNVLEFCSHASVTWSGFAYKPFAKNKN